MNTQTIAPVIDYYEPTMVSVTYILQNTTGSCDFGDVDDYANEVDFWETMISDKASDTGFGHLVESMLAKGFLPEGSLGWHDGCFTEGHHRFVAALLLGLDEVPVTSYGNDVYGHHGDKLARAHYNFDDPYSIDV